MRSCIARVALCIGLTGCGGSQDASPVLPVEPAACAGEGRRSTDDQRLEQWQTVREELLADAGAPSEVWVGLAEVTSAGEVTRLVSGFGVSGIFLAYEQEQGTLAKVIDAPPEGTIEPDEIEAFAEHVLRRTIGGVGGEGAGPFAPADAEVVAGAPPIVGVRLQGEADGLATFIAEESCSVHSLAPADATAPVLAATVEP